MDTQDLSDLGIVPWTRREFQRELRRAGWRRMSGPAAVYRSPDDRDWLFHMDDYREWHGVLWEYFAARRQLPTSTPPMVEGTPDTSTPVAPYPGPVDP